MLIKAILSSHITVGDSVMALKPSSQVQKIAKKGIIYM